MKRVFWTVVALACGPQDDWQPASSVDQGALCFAQGNGEVLVLVDPGVCLSSSCTRNLVGSCEVTVAGSDITVTSDISWEENRGRNIECTTDCGSAATNCTFPTPADGTYTVTLGDHTEELVVPVADNCPESPDGVSG